MARGDQADYDLLNGIVLADDDLGAVGDESVFAACEEFGILCIDNGLDPRNGGKCIFTSNVTCMACYCSWSKRKPLTVRQVLDNITKLIDELDVDFYNRLLG